MLLLVIEYYILYAKNLFQKFKKMILRLFGIDTKDQLNTLEDEMHLINQYIKKQIELNKLLLKLHQENDQKLNEIIQQIQNLNDEMIKTNKQLERLQYTADTTKKRKVAK